MDRNSILGFGLIAAVLIGFSYMNKPSDKEIAIQMIKVEKNPQQK